VQVGRRDTSGEGAVVGVDGAHVSGSLGGEMVELLSGHSGEDALDDLLGDHRGVAELGVESIGQLLNTTVVGWPVTLVSALSSIFVFSTAATKYLKFSNELGFAEKS